MTAQLVTDALVMAIWRRGKPDALLHHSDHGSQYTSEQFQRLMADHGVTCSMSRSGNVWDNAAMESFFSSLKTERTARKTYRLPRRGQGRCVRLHRALLQSQTPSLDDRLSQPNGVRDADWITELAHDALGRSAALREGCDAEKLFPTSLVGSYPQPDWLIDRKKLAGRFPPRVRAKELWRVAPECLEQAQDDATILAIRDQERAGLDIITDGEMRRESYSNRFATALEGVDIDNPGTALDRSGHPNPVPRVAGKIRRKHRGRGARPGIPEGATPTAW